MLQFLGIKGVGQRKEKREEGKGRMEVEGRQSKRKGGREGVVVPFNFQKVVAFLGL